MIDDASILGTIRTVEDLHQLMRERVVTRGHTLESIGRAASLPDRYANKVLSPHPKKGLGMLSMPGLMEALGVELIAVERSDVPKRITDKLEKSKSPPCERAVRNVRMMSKRFLRAIAKKGGRARAANLSPDKRRQQARNAGRARQKGLAPAQRTELARSAARARWSRVKASEQPPAPVCAVGNAVR